MSKGEREEFEWDGSVQRNDLRLCPSIEDPDSVFRRYILYFTQVNKRVGCVRPSMHLYDSAQNPGQRIVENVERDGDSIWWRNPFPLSFTLSYIPYLSTVIVGREGIAPHILTCPNLHCAGPKCLCGQFGAKT